MCAQNTWRQTLDRFGLCRKANEGLLHAEVTSDLRRYLGWKDVHHAPAFPGELGQTSFGYRDSDASMARVAEDFGISTECLKRWLVIDEPSSSRASGADGLVLRPTTVAKPAERETVAPSGSRPPRHRPDVDTRTRLTQRPGLYRISPELGAKIWSTAPTNGSTAVGFNGRRPRSRH
jgi:hypothetical protein